MPLTGAAGFSRSLTGPRSIHHLVSSKAWLFSSAIKIPLSGLYNAASPDCFLVAAIGDKPYGAGSLEFYWRDIEPWISFLPSLLSGSPLSLPLQQELFPQLLIGFI